MSLLSVKSLESLKRFAKELKRMNRSGMTYQQCLEQTAKDAGFRSYGEAKARLGDGK